MPSSPADIEHLEQRIAELEQTQVQALRGSEAMAGLLKQLADNTTASIEQLKHLEEKRELAETVESISRVSRLYTKTRSVIFIGRKSFSENVKYACLAFCRSPLAKGIDCTWLAHDEKQYQDLLTAQLPCRVLYPASLTQDVTSLLFGAKLVVTDDLLFPQTHNQAIIQAFMKGARVIQLWHGVPVKETGLRSFASIEMLSACGPFEVLVATNAASYDYWKPCFAFKEFAPIGYPRTDVFFHDVTPEELINVDRAAFDELRAAFQANKPAILYAPTFRDGRPGWIDHAGVDRIAQFCRGRGYAFCVKLHPFEQQHGEELRRKFPEIRFIEPYTDSYPLLKYTSLLLTDYSSIALDFLLLDRPVAYYRPDHGDYVQMRKMAEGSDRYICGDIATSAEEAIRLIDGVATQTTDPYREKRQALRDQLFDHRDGQAGTRLAALIAAQIDAP